MKKEYSCNKVLPKDKATPRHEDASHKTEKSFPFYICPNNYSLFTIKSSYANEELAMSKKKGETFRLLVIILLVVGVRSNCCIFLLGPVFLGIV